MPDSAFPLSKSHRCVCEAIDDGGESIQNPGRILNPVVNPVVNGGDKAQKPEYAVRTPYENSDGDPLLVYFRREGTSGRWRIEDDGTQVALLEAHGVDLSGKARGEAFQALLDEYGASFSKDERTVHTPSLSEVELGEATVRFVGLLLRLQDLSLLSPQVVRSAWRADALSAIHGTFDNVADVKEWRLCILQR